MECMPSTSRQEAVFKKLRVEDCVQQDGSSDTEVEEDAIDDDDVRVQLNSDEIAAVMSQLPFKKVVRLGRINKQWSEVSPRVTIREVKLGSDLGLESMSVKRKDAIARIRLIENFKGVRRINVEKIKSSVRIKPLFQDLGSFCSRVEEIVGSTENIEVSKNGYSIGMGLNQSLYSYIESVAQSGNDNNIQVIYLQTRDFDPKRPYDEDENIYELVKRCPRAKKLVLALTRMEVSKRNFLKTWSEFGSRITKINFYRGDQSVFDSFINLNYLTEFKTQIRDIKLETISSLADHCKFLQTLSLPCTADFVAVIRRFNQMKRLCLRMKTRPFGNLWESELFSLFNDDEFAQNLTSIKLVNHTQTAMYDLPASVINAIASTCIKLKNLTLGTKVRNLMPLDQLTTLQSITIMNNGYNRTNILEDVESVLANNGRLIKFTIVRSFTGHPENMVLLESMVRFLTLHPLIKFKILLTHQIDTFEEKWYRRMMSRHDNLSVQYKRVI